MLQLRADAAREARAALSPNVPASAPSQALAALLSLVKQHGCTLLPVHPGATDPGLVTHFLVDLPDRAAAERLVPALLQLDIVEGAYLGAQSEPP
jgi:hypothetical protein